MSCRLCHRPAPTARDSAAIGALSRAFLLRRACRLICSPHPHGDTSAANLAGFCTTDHRGKHQAPGWQHTLTAEGILTVTTPTGLTAVTTPPPF